MTTIPPDRLYFRPDEVAAILAVPVRTVYHWISIREIRAVRMGHRIRIARSELTRILADTPPRTIERAVRKGARSRQ